MELALYHPEEGYYTSGRCLIGREGDFYTAPDVSPLFGAMLARQMVEMWKVMGEPERFDLVEFGPGKGTLARDILTYIKAEHPRFFSALTYYGVEVSPSFAVQQQEILSRSFDSENVKICWVKDLSLIGSESGITGCIFSNELIDAFPVHRVRKVAGKLKEIYVGLEEGGFMELPGPLSKPQLGTYFSELGAELEDGQTAEVNLNALDWLKKVAANLRRGFVLTIDYGLETRELYDPVRFDGTLRCFSKHCLTTDPYQRPGQQDITAHVNFSALIKWGENYGLLTAGLVPLARFLINLGLLETVEGQDDFQYNPEALKKTMAIKQLIMPHGMGSIFKVLIQYKGLTEPPVLTGLKGKKRCW